uniref:Putative vitamin B12-binding domain containing protein n=1 Tax=viral metagenome TaxID=1070528 RepID=A0A6M3KVR7_9ZZZZ
MKHKVLLVGRYNIIEPLGIMTLASVIKEEGHCVDIFLYRQPDGSDIIPHICEGSYDMVGFSCYTGLHKVVYRKALALKGNHKVIIGGPHTTAFMQECSDYADYVVVGEGVSSIRGVLNGSIKPGIVFSPYLVAPNHIPVPDRKIVYGNYPKLKDNPIKSVITSMGCKFSCDYCYNPAYRKLYPQFKVRQRTVESVVEECVNLKQYGTKMIFFQDDHFGLDVTWLNDFSKAYKKHVGLPFHCQMRPESISEGRLKLIKQAGCISITMAIETYNDSVRKYHLGRSGGIDIIKHAGHLVSVWGLALRTQQMLALPDTTKEDELNLLQLNIELQPAVAWTSIFAPYLGTPLGDWCKASGWYDGTNDDLDDNFFSNTRLNFDPDRVRFSNMLHRIFATCVKIPHGLELAKRFLNDGALTFDGWYHTVKQLFYDKCLYNMEE